MLAGAYDRPIPPRLWSGAATAPVRQQVVQGDAVDLSRLPQMRYTEVETAAYLTAAAVVARDPDSDVLNVSYRSEEHTSELQSQSNLVCRLLLEKKKNTSKRTQPPQQHTP